jgi:hypothetical protein
VTRNLCTAIYDSTRGNLVEVKGTRTRNAVHTAIRQLSDYSRFVDPAPQLAVLLPTRPRPDLEALLTTQGVAAVWPEGRAFADNADGKFT